MLGLFFFFNCLVICSNCFNGMKSFLLIKIVEKMYNKISSGIWIEIRYVNNKLCCWKFDIFIFNFLCCIFWNLEINLWICFMYFFFLLFCIIFIVVWIVEGLFCIIKLIVKFNLLNFLFIKILSWDSFFCCFCWCIVILVRVKKCVFVFFILL